MHAVHPSSRLSCMGEKITLAAKMQIKRVEFQHIYVSKWCMLALIPKFLLPKMSAYIRFMAHFTEKPELYFEIPDKLNLEDP